MSAPSGTSGLFTALVDDAGLFPPTALHMDEALARHQRDLDEGSPVLTHRFLCPASRLDALRRISPGPNRIGLILDTHALPDFTGLPVDLVETKQPPEEVEPIPGVRVFAEVVPRRQITGLREGVGLKVRCGGLTADAFPTPEHLGAFIEFCAEHDVPFKATAGLHHAVRHFDPSLGVDRHGFLNLVLAVCEAAERRDPVPILRTTDVGLLVRLAHAVSEETAKRARQLLVSYGSCSTSTPIDDLKTLGVA
ncbi:hypothetical protein OIE66_00450 [Nonomuraea sp. NBC_01738]|uniref:hypothetical protein n=1 Tax=Nonomuraea sp. NBC_01738 TaxID=2976003 RepID=UPI002E131300|nr:hypothetical protein OIE66_00450 [Nonomuraea sp. NBC_01738]